MATTAVDPAPIEARPQQEPPKAVALPSTNREVAATPASRPAAELWTEISHALGDADLSRPETHREIAWYRGQRKFLNEAAGRATPFLYFIWAEARRLELPANVVLLPIIESGYHSHIVSTDGAAGLWQFMGGTGTKFGLHQNEWIDGRLDVVASTTAALEYLNTLRQRFDGDWLLAIAAYNAGWGNIEKAIANNRRRGKPTDVWSLGLRPTTTKLIARMLALNEIFSKPQRFGLTLTNVPEQPYFVPVTLRRPTDLRRFAQLASLDESTFRALNPNFKRAHTGSRLPQRILVPAGSEVVAAKIAQNMTPHLPDRAQTAESNQNNSNTTRQHYRVRSGDSLWLIARRFDVHVVDLERWNNVRRNQALKIGQPLVVGTTPAGSPNERARSTRARHYRVQAGDSLWTISRQFNVTVPQLVAWNKLQRSRALQPGQELRVTNPS